jgi:hypothetical protein
LHDFEIDGAFLQMGIFIECESNGNRANIVPRYFVHFYEGFVGASSVFGRGGGGEMPFHMRGAADEGDVIEVNYLGQLASVSQEKNVEADPKNEFKFGLDEKLVSELCGLQRIIRERRCVDEPSEPWILTD